MLEEQIATETKPIAVDAPVVIFDGVCNFCNASIDFIMKRDAKGLLKFTANQHETGQQLLEAFGYAKEDVDTMYLYEQGVLYNRSTAALRIARHLRLPWNLLSVLIIIPKFIRDPVYRFVARNRYQWFGRKETCRIPTDEERSRFLL